MRDRSLRVAAGPSYRKHACHPRDDLRAAPDFAAVRLAGTLAARFGGLRASSSPALPGRPQPFRAAAASDEPRAWRLARSMSIRSMTLPPPLLGAGFSASEISLPSTFFWIAAS